MFAFREIKRVLVLGKVRKEGGDGGNSKLEFY